MRDQNTITGHWRVGRRAGQALWQIKEAPGWRVVHQVGMLGEAAAWLSERGVDLSTVFVLTTWPWPTLAEKMKGEAQ